MTRVSGPILLTLLVSMAGCGEDGPVQSPIEPLAPPPERDTTPMLGLDRAKLYRLADALGAGVHGAVDGILVQRNGQVVIEEYFRGTSRLDQHSLQSVTKSFASALIGIAISNGDVERVDALVMDHFPQWQETLGLNALRAQMRVEDILTMRTGTDYHEVGDDARHWELNSLPTGWDFYWLSRPMIRQPGTFWQYDSGGVIALSSIIKHGTGSHAVPYAAQWLFRPLGIQGVRWSMNQEGHPHLGGGLWLTQRDMVKLGQLYLQGGRWDGRQVVPEAWVEASFERQVSFQLPENSTQRAKWYGYLWWILEPDPDGAGTEDIRAAIGAGGQYVFVIPEHDMVVGVTSDVRTGDTWAPIRFLYSDVLPAVIR